MSQKGNISMFLVLLSSIIVNGQFANFVSPCPRLFRYEKDTMELGRWYGQIILIFNSDLHGVYPRLKFDRPVVQIGNSLGEIQENSNVEFDFKKPSFLLKANKPEKIRFLVDYKAGETPPQLTSYLLNARPTCPEKDPQNTTSSEFEEFWNEAGYQENRQSFAANISFYHKVQESQKIETKNNPDSISTGITDDCGQAASIPYPLISQGKYALQGESPWHAALYHYQGINTVYSCGGTLIGRNHIVTAAHCVTNSPSTMVLKNANELCVYLGRTNLRVIDRGTQFRGVSKIFVHPEYTARNFFNDIAILKLSEPIEITSMVRPCCLWEGETDINLISGQLGTVVGWGLDDTNEPSARLLKAKLPVIKQHECIYSNREFYAFYTFEKNFCAGYSNGTGVCNGDSGGGLTFSRSNKVSYLRGIVSNGQDPGCDKYAYSIFTDVAQHLPWIKETLLK